MTTHSPFGTPDDPFGADAFDDESERDQFGRLVTAPSNPVPPMRRSWRKGTLLEDGGESMFRLAKPVGDIGRNLQPDTAKVQGVLERAGFMDLTRTEGPTGLYSFLTEESIRAAQKANGLQIDGLIRPGGETIRMLRAKVGPRPASGTQVAQAAPAAPPPVPRRKPPVPAPAPGRPKPAVPARTPPSLISPVPTLKIRGRDIQGAGNFGASRDSGTRLHEGIDVEASPGSVATSTVDGKITRVGMPYSPGPYRYIEVTTPHGYVVRHLYVAPNVNLQVGSTVKAGITLIGTTQDIAAKYPGMTNHVHVEIRDSRTPGKSGRRGYKGYRIIDQTPLLRRHSGP